MVAPLASANTPSSPRPPGIGSTIMGPTTTKTPWETVHIPAAFHLRHTVVEVFEYGCPYCRALNGALRRWGRSLPVKYQFAQMPALLTNQFFPMTLSTFGIEVAQPQKLGAFEYAAFDLIQTYKKPIDAPDTYFVAAAKAGITPKQFMTDIRNPEVIGMAHMDYQIMKITGIHQTPTLIICGRYAISPADVKGNYGMFIQLANALVSSCMRHMAP
jgi:thiol:disulfide interchange protein DsbA